MGAHRNGQEGALAPLWKYCNVFCAVIVTAKRSDEIFICIVFTISRRLGFWASPSNPHRRSIPGTRWRLSAQSAQIPNLPTPGNAHVYPSLYIQHAHRWPHIIIVGWRRKTILQIDSSCARGIATVGQSVWLPSSPYYQSYPAASPRWPQVDIGCVRNDIAYIEQRVAS